MHVNTNPTAQSSKSVGRTMPVVTAAEASRNSAPQPVETVAVEHTTSSLRSQRKKENPLCFRCKDTNAPEYPLCFRGASIKYPTAKIMGR
jgi:hypothetical protein